MLSARVLPETRMINDGGAFRELRDRDSASDAPQPDNSITRFPTFCDDFNLQFNPRKFRSIVHYCCWICEDPRVLDFAKLNWVLWYCERHNYIARGTPLTGATYRKFAAGPLATPTNAAITELEKVGAIARRDGGVTGIDRYFAVTKPDISPLDSEQIAMVETIVRTVCFNIASAAVDKRVDDRVFQIARLGEVIPYFTVFGGRAGSLSEHDLAWAIQRVGVSQAPFISSDCTARKKTVCSSYAALIWHILREPEIGTSLHLPGSSWFLYKQNGIRDRAPSITIIYTFVMDELVIGGLRFDHDFEV